MTGNNLVFISSEGHGNKQKSFSSPEYSEKANCEKPNDNLHQKPIGRLETALKYNQLGFPVIPVYYKTKISVIKWEPYQNKVPTMEEITKWFTNTNHNIAIVLGKISSSFEIDIDGEEGKKHFEEAFSRFNQDLQSAIRNTMRVVTSNGLKLIFRFRPEEWPEGIKNCKHLWVGQGSHNGIELRANGSYCLGIGSVHPDGTPYVLENDGEFNPLTLTKSEIEELVHRIGGENLNNAEKVIYESSCEEDTPVDIIPLGKLDENTISTMAANARNYYLEGSKNYFILAFCGNLRRLGVTYEDVYKLAYIIDPADAKNLNRIKYIFNHTGRLAGKGYLIKVFREKLGLGGLQIVQALQELLGPIEKLRAKQQQQEHNQEEERQKEEGREKKKQEKYGSDHFDLIETKKSSADILYDLAKDKILERFEDQNTGELYAAYEVNGHQEVHSLESVEFQYFLRQLFERDYQKQQEYFESKNKASKRGTLFDFLKNCEKVQLKIYSHEKIIGKEHLNNSIQQLKATVTEKRPLYLRSFYENGVLRYDLMDDEWKYVEIGVESGIRVCEGSYRYFKRYDNNHSQVAPAICVSDKDVSKGRSLFNNLVSSFNTSGNETNDKILLFKVYWVALYFNTSPKFPMPIPAVSGPHDSAKSTLLATIKYHIDPVSAIDALVDRWGGGQKDDQRRRGLIVSRNYLTYFDNVSHLTNEESDELCIYATGADYQERKLHTNTEIVKYRLQANIGYNGINDLARNPDLLSRIIHFELEKLKQKIPFKLYWRQREDERPLILGYIFDVIRRVISRYEIEADKLSTTHRLADFIILGELISQELGEKPGRFLTLFQNIAYEQTTKVIENNFFAQILIEYILSREYLDANRKAMTKWGIATTTFHTELVNFAKSKGYNISAIWGFPEDAVGLGIKLNRLKSTLVEIGIKIEKKKGRANSKWLIEVSTSDNNKENEDGNTKIQQQQVSPIA
jgi:hypothetical protein